MPKLLVSNIDCLRETLFLFSTGSLYFQFKTKTVTRIGLFLKELGFCFRDLRPELKIFCSKLFSQTKEFDPKMVLVKVLDQFSRFF